MRWVLVFLFVWLAVSAGVVRLRIDMSVEAFFGGDDPARLHLEDFRAYWGADDDVLMVVASVDEGDLLRPGRLELLGELGDALVARDSVTAVDSVATAPRLQGDLPGVIDMSPVLDSVPNDAAALAPWR